MHVLFYDVIIKQNENFKSDEKDLVGARSREPRFEGPEALPLPRAHRPKNHQ